LSTILLALSVVLLTGAVAIGIAVTMSRKDEKEDGTVGSRGTGGSGGSDDGGGFDAGGGFDGGGF